jgi:hypothetical protein
MLTRPAYRDDRMRATQNDKSESAKVVAPASRTCDGSVGQRAGTARVFFRNKSSIRELMAAVPGLVREGDQVRQPNCSMENVSGIG